ncbi:MAG: nicotinate-nucleotide--dimethylbenzimidazole phosphoribosyltransferase [Ghiorsea sp.]|nr:nicotinate-nucleotide--dimethylbenzimidazole phosphoribosyltransferase [Ghiorsea sp.]
MTIQTWHANIEQEARSYQNRLTKPQGSLGRLEDISCWFAACQGKFMPDKLTPHITIFAADHGVTKEGISAFPSVVTTEMLKNFSQGGAAINVLAKQAGATLSIVDVGVLLDTSPIKGITHAKVCTGTANLKTEAAMTADECAQAMQVGKQEAIKAIDNGANILIAGDMGIGNTTASACLICLFTKAKPEDVVGSGTGIDDATLAHKVAIVTQALQRIHSENLPPETYLAQVGGLEIAAIAGFYLEAAKQGIPILLDGFITTAAALAAQQQENDIQQWMLASHQSQEQGHALALKKLQLSPLFNLQLRLGEGSGAALALPLLQSAIALHREMATFESANVSVSDKNPI